VFRRGLRRIVLSAGVALFAHTGLAFDPVTLSVCGWLATAIVAPVGYLLGSATAFSPPIRVFGTEHAVYGLDWGSLACHAGSVYGMQLSFCGGSFENRLYGLQAGILASGYAMQELPFGDYHFCNLDLCRMNGVQFGTFAAKTSTANGVQISAVYAESRTVNGFQLALVNSTQRLHGMQVGVFNSAQGGVGVQVGLVNCVGEGLASCLPLVNLSY